MEHVVLILICAFLSIFIIGYYISYCQESAEKRYEPIKKDLEKINETMSKIEKGDDE